MQSVVNQSYSPAEIIVIDDGSTDDTIKRVQEFDIETKIIQLKENSSAQHARNIGIKSAKSEWIAFLDSDDEWLPDKLEKQISALKSVNFDYNTVVHGNCFIINEDNKKYWKLDTIEGVNVYKHLLSQSGTLFPSILTSKQALEKINYLDEKTPSFHEWETSIQLAKFCKFIHIQEPLFNYFIHEDTISKSTKSLGGYGYIVKKHEKDIKELCGPDVYLKHQITYATLALNNRRFKSGRNILKSVPFNIKKLNLIFLSYLRIKPIYLTKILQSINGKRS